MGMSTNENGCDRIGGTSSGENESGRIRGMPQTKRGWTLASILEVGEHWLWYAHLNIHGFFLGKKFCDNDGRLFKQQLNQPSPI